MWSTLTIGSAVAALRSGTMHGGTVEFGWSEEQQRLRARVIEFARRELPDDVARRDRDGEFSRAAWAACAELGIQGLAMPQQYGGADADPLTFTLAMEALGYACADNGLLFSLGAQICSVQAPLMRFGTDEQKARYLPGLCDGTTVGAHAMTEDLSGSDAFSLATTAARDGDHFILNGSKRFITAAPVADVIVVFARTKPTGGFSGLSVFLVDRSTPGLHVGPPIAKMGLRTSPMSELALDDCRVREEQLLGPLGAGFAIFSHSMEWERSHIFACSVGAMQRQLELAVDRDGGPPGTSSARMALVGELELRLHISRLLLYKVAWLRSRGEPAALHAAMVKLQVSESFLASSLDALAAFGGPGDLPGSTLERDMRDAVGGCIYSGTSDIQRNIIAAQLGL